MTTRRATTGRKRPSGPASGAKAARRAAAVDPRIAEVVRRIVRHLAPRRVILFGSRARGDADRFSDIDLAVDVAPVPSAAWCDLVDDLELHPPTLLEVDIVFLSRLDPAWRERIERLGVVVHGDGAARDLAR